jgi:hypothetical protein
VGNFCSVKTIAPRYCRSLASVACATAHPLFSSPRRLVSGITTSSKKTSLNSCAPLICRSGRTVIPGVRMSTTKYDSPRCFGASGSVRASNKP